MGVAAIVAEICSSWCELELGSGNGTGITC